jgi:hypothetical protein
VLAGEAERAAIAGVTVPDLTETELSLARTRRARPAGKALGWLAGASQLARLLDWLIRR